MAKIYTNQPVTLDLTFTDQDGTVIDISGCSVEAELYAPGSYEIDTTITGLVVSGEGGTATANVPADTLDTVGEWRAQGYVTKSGTRWPAEVSSIYVCQRGSLN